MNIYQLRQFLAVAGEKSITEAADHLHISQQALSKSIHQLESEWGVRLFSRSKQGISLTTAGMQILPIIQSLLEKYDSHMAAVQNVILQSRYTLRLSVENAIIINAVPYELLSRVGNIRIQANVSNGILQCMNDVKKGAADIALVTNPPADEAFLFLPLVERPPCVILPKEHPLSKKKEIRIMDLKDERHVWFSMSSAACDEYIHSCMNQGYYPRFSSAYPTGEMILKAVEAGEGITVAFELVHLPDESGLIRRPLSAPPIYRLGLLLTKERDRDSTIRSFYNALLTYFA